MLLALLAAATPPLPPRPTAVAVHATARGRVIHAEPASRIWKEGSAQKREIVVRERDGSRTRLRLVEHE